MTKCFFLQIAAQSCSCDAMIQCTAQHRNARSEAEASCESNCTSQLTGGVNAQAVLSCYKKKRTARDTKKATEDTCVYSQASV